MANLPEGWLAKKSTKTDRTYYCNEYTKATQWEIPEPVGPGQVGKNSAMNDFTARQLKLRSLE